MKYNRHTKTNSGFTLVEMLINILIFSLLLTVSMGSVLIVLDSNRKAQTIKTAVDNLNFALETMSRDIRFGHDYKTIGSDIIKVKSNRDVNDDNIVNSADTIEYHLKDATLYRVLADDIYNPTPITSKELEIQHLSFHVVGNNGSDGEQAKVLVVIKGYAETRRNVRTDFNLQTTFTQRRYDTE